MGDIALKRPRALCFSLALLLGVSGCGGVRTNVLISDGTASVVVMDFSVPFALEPPPSGWYHRTFLMRDPMTMTFGEKEGVKALRAETEGSASMLFRHVDLALDEHPVLRWSWFVERGLSGAVDERTSEGDDHPARLYLSFMDTAGESHSLEIIWGNSLLKRGDYKHLKGFFDGSFPHYVANGGSTNTGRWHFERVDLAEIHRELWGDPAGVRLSDVAIFCDSDETGERTIAWFGEVRLEKRQ